MTRRASSARSIFCVAVPATELGLYESENVLWAEAKAGVRKDIHESFVQLILTIGRARTFDRERPPIFLGAFDAEKIAFLPYEAVMGVFDNKLGMSEELWNKLKIKIEAFLGRPLRPIEQVGLGM